VIILSKNISGLRVKDTSNALCVRHKTYPLPVLDEGAKCITYEELAKDPTGAMNGRDRMIAVGINKMVSPSNRTKTFRDLMHAARGIPKVSIDTTLFVSAPWRAWWHFGFVEAAYREYTYSYLAESHWKAHEDGVRKDDPFALEVLIEHGQGLIRCDYDRWFDRIDERIVEMSDDTKKAYAELKARCFDEEHLITPIINRLSKFADKACGARAIPKPHRLFSKTDLKIVRTDMAVDKYLAGQLLRFAGIADGIAAEFYDAG
jgi:hypothetical protein